MQAEGIRRGDRQDRFNERGRMIGGWTATGNAVVEGNTVYVPVRLHDGHEDTNVYRKGEQVDLTWGVGSDPNTDDEKTGVEQLKDLLSFDEG